MPLAARAASSEDVIITTDGAILRGHVERRPVRVGHHRSPRRRTRTLEWREIAKSEGPSFPRPHRRRARRTSTSTRSSPARPRAAPRRVGGKQQSISLHLRRERRSAIDGASASPPPCDTPCTMYCRPAPTSCSRSVASSPRTPVTARSAAPVKRKAASRRARCWFALVAIGRVPPSRRLASPRPGYFADCCASCCGGVVMRLTSAMHSRSGIASRARTSAASRSRARIPRR